MPPESPRLPEEVITLIGKWIDTGLRETSSSKALLAKSTLTFVPGTSANAKPDGPPAMPVDLPEVEVAPTSRNMAILGLAASPWAPLAAASGCAQQAAGCADDGLSCQEPLQQLHHRAAGGVLPHSQGRLPAPRRARRSLAAARSASIELLRAHTASSPRLTDIEGVAALDALLRAHMGRYAVSDIAWHVLSAHRPMPTPHA